MLGAWAANGRWWQMGDSDTNARETTATAAGADSVPADDVAILRALVEGTAAGTGQAFFESLVQHLATAVGARYAFIAEFVDRQRDPLRARSLAYWSRDGIAKNFEWDLRGTPCEDVVRGNLCHYPTDVAARFPADKPLAAMGIQS